MLNSNGLSLRLNLFAHVVLGASAMRWSYFVAVSELEGPKNLQTCMSAGLGWRIGILMKL